MLLKRASILTLTVVLLGCMCAVNAQNKRGPSTPEERQRAVEMATFLETNPLAKEARDYRSALLFFLTEVPDISVTVCMDVLGQSKQVKGDYDSELLGQLVFSQAKFVIQNPDKAKDSEAVYLAGVEGVLRTWQAIKAAKPKAKFPLMDELLAKQQAGTLAAHVQSGMTGCKKPVSAPRQD